MRNNQATPESKDYKEGGRFLDEAQESMPNLTNFAHYEKLRDNLHQVEPTLFGLAVGAIVGLGKFAVSTGIAKAPESRPKPSVTNVSIDAQPSSFGLPAPTTTQSP